MNPVFRITRLAPSPTGALHLGHARTFLITWWLARQCKAKILMRMDDLDLGRAKPESVQQAYDDLHWLGMDWDEGETVQSQRGGLYESAIDILRGQNAVYPCTCSRADIAAAVAHSASAPHATDPHVRYPGTCANNASDSIPSVPFCWRLRVPKQTIDFQDAVAGVQSFDVSADAGDFPITRFDGTPAYQLACVIDDHAMQIDMVIRGDDLLSSTPRQLLLYEALHYAVPQFAHVPLVVGVDGKRLAKRHGESRIAQFRDAKIRPERIVGWIAYHSGQLEKLQEISAPELIERFDLSRLSPSPFTMRSADLEWLK